jgi:O-antigen/teichoic acid export membrane protein
MIVSEPADDGRDETREERLDRNTIEMVQELRVGAVGVQVLFAFLLVVPFNAGWKLTTGFEHAVYYATLICIAAATVLLIAPSIHHRVLFRQGEKPFLIGLGNRLMITAMVFVAAGMAGIFVLISDFVFGGWAAAVGGVVTAAVVTGLWFGVPLWHRAHSRARDVVTSAETGRQTL